MTPKQAVREILGTFKTVWDAQGYGSASNNYNAEYEGVPKGERTVGQPWARPTVRHVTDGPESMTGASGKTIWTAHGFIMVEVYVPVGQGHDYDLARTIKNAFRGTTTSSGVIFRNARVNEIGLDGNFVHHNVVADFEYDEVI